jgi:poly-beta-1,6-N-acetyl-D-glucosamine synthase
MPINIVSDRQQEELANEHIYEEDEIIEYSVGIMTYNEEANIARTLEAVLEQSGPSIRLHEIIVVASGCTDRTIAVVSEMALKEPRIRLCVQEKREGKASAINLFLKQATSPVVVLIGADVIPETSAIEQLCAPFKDASIGMVGGRPVPINDPNTFMGHTVHLLWRLHDRVARIHPKLGEVIAFRNVISGIPADSSVDEISIQALITQLGYKLIYRPNCVVYNKGPVTVRDYLPSTPRPQPLDRCLDRVGGLVRRRRREPHLPRRLTIFPLAPGPPLVGDRGRRRP